MMDLNVCTVVLDVSPSDIGWSHLYRIVVDHDEVVGQAAAHHGSEDPSIYGNALKHVANNRVII